MPTSKIQGFIFVTEMLSQMVMSDNAPNETLEAKLCFNAYRLNRSFARFYQTIFADSGLTYPKYVILTVLAENGALSITELSERAGVETNTLSPLLKRMASFGVITRERDPKDERRMVLTLTGKGAKALEIAKEAVDRGFDQLGLDPSEVRKLIALMAKVQDRLGEADPASLDTAALSQVSK